MTRTVPRRSNQAEAAFGFKAHSGWAALVVLGTRGDDLEVLERSRVELVEEEWAKQPYHAAEELKPAEARKVVKRGIDAAKRIAALGKAVGPPWSKDQKEATLAAMIALR